MKTFFKQLTAVSLALLVFACSKKNEPIVPAAQNNIKDSVFVKNGRMIFSEVSNYENMVNNHDVREKTFRNTRSTSFTSLGSSSTENIDLYDSEFLQKVLNQDGVIQIGKWIIKVDMAKALCYVLPDKFANEYQDLVEAKTTNDHILVYSTEEDVLELLANNEPSARTSGLFCKDRQANGKKTDGYTYINYDHTLRLDSKVVYQKAGIYFSLQGKVKAQEYLLGVWIAKGLDMRLDYGYSFNVRCGYSDSGANVIRESNNEINYRPYENIKGLKNYDYTIRTNVYDNNVCILTTQQYNIND
jgi:hypothetical protein